MTEITAAMVKELRDATGAPMMDCKRALQETSGDSDAARTLLREKGLASAAKRADRATTEGIILTVTDDDLGTIVAVGCETEPVSKNEDFEAFARDVLREVHEHGESAVDVLDERRAELSGRLGENIQVVGARRMHLHHGEHFGAYVHKAGSNNVGVLLRAKGGDPGTARLLALHIAYAKPTYTARSEVPAEAIAAEREILANTDEVLSKPENVRDKIVEGMLNKRFFAESVLDEQVWIHDTSLTVKKALEQGGLELVEYAWFALG